MSEIKKHISVVETDNGHGILSYLTMEMSDKLSPEGFPEMGLKMKTKHVELETHQVKSVINSEQMQDLEAMGINTLDTLNSTLLNESEMGQEKQIYKKMKLLGYESNRKLWTRFENFAHKWTGYVPMLDISKSGVLLRKVNFMSQIIASTSRLGPANFVIIGPCLLEYFITDPGFVHIQHDSALNPGKIYMCGTYRDQVQVLVNPGLLWTDKRMVIGRDSSPQNEGVFLVEHKEGSVFDKREYVNPTFLTPMIEMVLRKRYALTHTQNAAKNYITLTCSNKKHNVLTHIIEKYFKKKK